MRVNTATLDFIRLHAKDNVQQLALRGTKETDVDLPFALDQIAGRQTAHRKIPTWAATEGIFYPPHLSMEQCSSETTARYKAQLVSKFLTSHPTLSSSFLKLQTSFLDLTGGLGVDFSFLAPMFGEAVYVERQLELCEKAHHNLRLLGLEKAEIVCAEGENYLSQTNRHYTLIYVDPARRNVHGARTYAVSDCTPDILALRDELEAKSEVVLLKLSPMLDWQKAVNDLGRQWVREVHIVSVGNECKELLLLLYRGEGLRVVCENDGQVFENCNKKMANEAHGPHMLHEDHSAPNPLPKYLYEPNASIMKAGCFAELSLHFGISQIAPNSHLFLADKLITDFPGRAFEIIDITTLNKRELKEKLRDTVKANIAVRNFPLSVAELRRKLKIDEGGSTYIFATTLASGDRRLIVCQKVI